MQNITAVKDYTISGTFDVSGSIKPDKDATESKRFTLRFKMDNVPLMDIIGPAISAKKITWANGKGRDGFDKLKNGQVVEVNYTSPSTNIKSREELIDEAKVLFVKAGLPEAKALELATKAIDNPELLK